MADPHYYFFSQSPTLSHHQIMLLSVLATLPSPPSNPPPPYRTLPACPEFSHHSPCRCPLADRRRCRCAPSQPHEPPTQSSAYTAAPCTIIATDTPHPYPHLADHLKGHTGPRFGPFIPPCITTWSLSNPPSPPHHQPGPPKSGTSRPALWRQTTVQRAPEHLTDNCRP